MKYGFGKLADGKWEFYGHITGEDFDRIYRAAHTYAYRHDKRVEVKHGSDEQGIHGAWVRFNGELLPHEQKEPRPGDIREFRHSWPLGQIHYHGSGFIQLPHEPMSDEMKKATRSLLRAIRGYEKKHGIVFGHKPKINEDGKFGWWFEVKRTGVLT